MILPLEDQVAPLALCQRLKELGAPQETLYHWRLTEPPDIVAAAIFVGPTTVGSDRPGKLEMLNEPIPEFCAAYTVAELGAMLPWAAYSLRQIGGWEAAYRALPPETDEASAWVDGDAEAEVRANLLIALVDRGVVKFDKAVT